MDSTPSHGPEPRTVGTRGEALPVDPDLPQAERVPEQQQVSPRGGVGRRRARPRLMWVAWPAWSSGGVTSWR